jgi:hypothetical protein
MELSEMDLEYISKLVKQGFTSGYDPIKWNIDIEFDNEHEEEETLEYIAKLIKEGFTSGYYPNWNINY